MKKMLAIVAGIALSLSACGIGTGTPQSCLDALNRADETLVANAKVWDAVSRSSNDYKDWLKDFERSSESYKTARDACRATAK